MPRRRTSERDNRGPGQRQLRVGEELRHLLAELLERGDMRDPDLRGASITVTAVDVSPDLRNAIAFVMPLGGQDEPRLLAAMRRAAPGSVLGSASAPAFAMRRRSASRSTARSMRPIASATCYAGPTWRVTSRTSRRRKAPRVVGQR